MISEFFDWLFGVKQDDVPQPIIEAQQTSEAYLPRVRVDPLAQGAAARFPNPAEMPVGTRADLAFAPDYSKYGIGVPGARAAQTDSLSEFLRQIFTGPASQPQPSSRPPVQAPEQVLANLGGAPVVNTPVYQSPAPFVQQPAPVSTIQAVLPRPTEAQLMSYFPNNASYWQRWQSAGAKPGGHIDTFGDFAGYVAAETNQTRQDVLDGVARAVAEGRTTIGDGK